MLAQQDQVDFHFGTDDMFEENVMLRDEKKDDDGDDSGDDQDANAGYPNINSSGGYVIKLGS